MFDGKGKGEEPEDSGSIDDRALQVTAEVYKEASTAEDAESEDSVSIEDGVLQITAEACKKASTAEDAEPEDGESIENRVLQITAEAYKKASSAQDADEECRYLKRMGVILPNGFTPLPPLNLKIGNDLLKSLNM